MRLFRVSGIDLDIHPSFWLMVAWLGFVLPPSFLRSCREAGLIRCAAASVAVAALLAASIWAHEMAHSLVARSFGIPVRRIVLFMFGGCAFIDVPPRRPLHELLVSVAGPSSSLAIATLMLAVSPWVLGADGFGNWVYTELVALNFALAAFNMLPFHPLDGGRVLHSVVWRLAGIRAADLSSGYSGAALSVAFALWGAADLFAGHAVGLWRVMLGLFLLSMSMCTLKAARNGRTQGVDSDAAVAHNGARREA